MAKPMEKEPLDMSDTLYSIIIDATAYILVGTAVFAVIGLMLSQLMQGLASMLEFMHGARRFLCRAVRSRLTCLRN